MKRFTMRENETIFYTGADGNANPGQLISKHGLVYPAFERLADLEDAVELIEAAIGNDYSDEDFDNAVKKRVEELQDDIQEAIVVWIHPGISGRIKETVI